MSGSAARPRTAAILQSNYLPWKGYFDLIHAADVFVFYDDVQYTKNDWRNRNRVKAPGGAQWITIPTGTDLNRRIREVSLPDARWQAKHWKTLCQLYGRAPHFGAYRAFLEDFYLGRAWPNLSALNRHLIERIARDFLGIRTEFLDSADLPAAEGKQERLRTILKALGASRYLSGPAAKDYLDVAALAGEGIQIVWQDYAGYPEYPQFHPPFDHAVSVLDLLFHTGPDAPWYIWGWRQSASPPGRA